MTTALLSVRHLHVRFGAISALQDVNFELSAGETLGLVGESGSGKSTLARAILRLIPATSGRLLWCGEDLLSWSAKELRRRRRDMQIVFQDPMASLNPRMRVGDTLAEQLELLEPRLIAGAGRRKIAQMLERVGLPTALAPRYPHQLSGGQCQRIGIARAMMSSPQLLICDEPVSSLDVSIQGQIVNLLADLQQELGTAMLFISHNLAVVRHLSRRVLVLYRGRVVEVAGRDALFATPVHPYTRALLAAVPDPARALAGRALVIGDAASAARGAPARGAPARGAPARREAAGCSFHERCAYAQPICVTRVPELQIVEPGHAVACHRWREVVYSSAP